MSSKNGAPAGDGSLDSLVGQFSEWVEKVEEKAEQAENRLRDERRKIAADSRLIRGICGKSMREVARRMGVSAMFLSDLERGNRNWTAKQIRKWKEAMK